MTVTATADERRSTAPVRKGPADLVHAFRAMATSITLRVVEPVRGARSALHEAEDVFRRIEATCSRFDAASALSVANTEPDRWHQVPPECYDAIAAAAAAHRETDGLFDPRCLRALQSWGYDRSLPFTEGPVTLNVPDAPTPRPATTPWTPGLKPRSRAVRLGSEPVDLGGIGKGLAVRAAARQLEGAGTAVLVEAGGDCHLAGRGPDGTGWRVAVEDPWNADVPVAVLRLADVGCATSSLRLRRWTAGGRTVHHLVDPRTGGPSASGLVAVTVVALDPARAEVWSKALLLAGAEEARELAEKHGLAALWLDATGRMTCSGWMEPLVVWRRSDV